MNLDFSEEDWLVNIDFVPRPLILLAGNRFFCFSIPRDRWDKEFYKLKAG